MQRPSPAMVVALIALVAAVSGSAVAAVHYAKNSIPSSAIKSVQGKKVKGAVRSAKTAKSAKNATNAINALNAGHASNADHATNADHAANADNAGHAGSADTAGGLAGVQTVTKRGFASDAADFATAQAGATKVPLATIGPFTFYGKCFRDTSGPDTYGRLYIETTQDGGLLASNDSELSGGATPAAFLAPSTPEDDRYLQSADSLDNDSDLASGYHATFQAIAGDGTAVQGTAESGSKQGNLAGGNGVWGAGNTCLFMLTVGPAPSFGS